MLDLKKKIKTGKAVNYCNILGNRHKFTVAILEKRNFQETFKTENQDSISILHQS